MKTVCLYFSFDSEFYYSLFLDWLPAYRSDHKLAPFPDKFFPGGEGFFYCEYRIEVPADHAETIKNAALAYGADFLG